MPTNAEYEQREIDLALRQMAEVRRAPLVDRREAAVDFFEVMRDDPELVVERLGWLLDGNYGYGAMKLAQRVLASSRMNRVAALTQMIGVFEWHSPEDMTRQAWKRLTPGEKSTLAAAVDELIADADPD